MISAETHDDKHVFASMCTPTAQLTDLAKEILAKEVGYGIVRIDDLSVYEPDDTPQHKLIMENVVYGGKIASTVQLGPIPIQSTVGWCRWWAGAGGLGAALRSLVSPLRCTTTCIDVCLVCTWLSGRGTPPIN